MSFIFQAIPDRYDLRKLLTEGKRVHWVASRYRDQMTPGDIVYFWLAGDESHRGLYGWGSITGKPHSTSESGYRVEVLYQCSFLQLDPPSYLPSHQLSKDPLIRDHLLFRMPMGTNFFLNTDEDQAIRKAIKETLGESCLPPEVNSAERRNNV